MSATMKAAFKKKNEILIREIESLPPGPGQLKLRIIACGICGTDIHGAEEKFEKFGHEIAGEVIGTGEGVNYVKVGEKIVQARRGREIKPVPIRRARPAAGKKIRRKMRTVFVVPVVAERGRRPFL